MNSPAGCPCQNQETRRREMVRKKIVPNPAQLLLLACMVFLCLPALSMGADDTDSSECIGCHTDLEEMDDYGAKAASAAAAIAG